LEIFPNAAQRPIWVGHPSTKGSSKTTNDVTTAARLKVPFGLHRSFVFSGYFRCIVGLLGCAIARIGLSIIKHC
jgi:hypothetical protein